MNTILRKIKYLIFCFHKGHRFGTVKYSHDGETALCARCGYRKKRKYKRPPYHYDDHVY